MKNLRRTYKNKKKSPWTPRVPYLIPPNKAFKSIKDYDRKRERKIIEKEKDY